MQKTFGRYQILGEIGSGGQSTVYRGWDPVINRPVAIKQLKGVSQLPEGKKEIFLARFFQEAKVAGALNHPGIVSVYDVGSDESGPYLVMELVEGPNLAQILSNGKPLGEAATVRLMLDVCEALGYAHEKGVVHRDIKPANLLLMPSGRIKLVDFGIARLPSSTLTQTGELLGTIHYMSPEQVKGEEVGKSTDIFALGIVLYQCLTGDLPFSDGNPTTVIFKIVNAPHPPLEKLDSALAGRFAAIVDRALAKEPAGRYPNCEEMARDLRALQIKGTDLPLDQLFDMSGLEVNDPGTTATVMGPTGDELVDTLTPAGSRKRPGWRLPGLLVAVVVLSLGLFLGWTLLFQGVPEPFQEVVATPEQNLLNQAREAFAQGRIVGDNSDDALYLARTALALGAKDAQGLIDRIQDQLREKTLQRASQASPQEAAGIYAEFLEYFPDNPEIEALRVESSREEDRAQSEAKVRDLTARGQQALTDGNLKLALSLFQQALNADPSNARVQYMTGRLELQQGQLEEARKYLQKASQLEPLNPNYLLELSEVQGKLGEYSAAYDSLNRGLSVGGDNILGEKAAQARLKESRFQRDLSKLVPVETEAKHDHFVGSCRGSLHLTVKGVEFSSASNADHSFQMEWNQVAIFQLRGKQLIIEGEPGRKYEFQDIDPQLFAPITRLFADFVK